MFCRRCGANRNIKIHTPLVSVRPAVKQQLQCVQAPSCDMFGETEYVDGIWLDEKMESFFNATTHKGQQQVYVMGWISRTAQIPLDWKTKLQPVFSCNSLHLLSPQLSTNVWLLFVWFMRQQVLVSSCLAGQELLGEHSSNFIRVFTFICSPLSHNLIIRGQSLPSNGFLLRKAISLKCCNFLKTNEVHSCSTFMALIFK